MNWNDNPLVFVPDANCQQAGAMIEKRLQELNREGMILGLSGGLDSAVVAFICGKYVPTSSIKLIYMPDRDSKPRHRKDAEKIAKVLGVPLQVQDISPILEIMGVYDLLPIRFAPGRKLKEFLVQIGKKFEEVNTENILQSRLSPRGGTFVSKGNAYGMIKHRVRMVTLYHHANIDNLMVVGAANKTELLTGTFAQWGCDQCADVMPILHLYRSQVEVLAEFLGIPVEIRTKPADPDVIPGVDNKEELLGSFRTTDLILWGLEHGMSKDVLVQRFHPDEIERIIGLYEASRFMREVPYHLV